MDDSRPPRLLIVEDEPGDAYLMKVALQKSGYAVDLHEAGDGGEALRFLLPEGGQSAVTLRPDLILLDLKMPGQSGLEFLETLKRDAHLRAIPVVIVTTSTLDADVLAAYRCGAAGYVPKPADINEFIAAIHRLCRYWFSLVRLPENPA